MTKLSDATSRTQVSSRRIHYQSRLILRSSASLDFIIRQNEAARKVRRRIRLNKNSFLIERVSKTLSRKL